MQEPGPRRTTPPFAGVDLRRPRGYLASAPAEAEAPAQAETGDPCPRCESLDTKFCYYNNYNTSQPRHYCKSCRRYWTKGGSLRNVPVGGASRKSSSASSPSAPKRTKNSKRRRVAPALEPEQPSTDASTAAAADAVATTEAATESTADDPAAPPAADGGFTAAAADAATTEAVAKSTADDPAPPAAADGGFTDPPVALGVGLADAGGKEPSDASPFEWPSGCDLGSYWGNGVFADTDPALFLNQP